MDKSSKTGYANHEAAYDAGYNDGQREERYDVIQAVRKFGFASPLNTESYYNLRDLINRLETGAHRHARSK